MIKRIAETEVESMKNKKIKEDKQSILPEKIKKDSYRDYLLNPDLLFHALFFDYSIIITPFNHDEFISDLNKEAEILENNTDINLESTQNFFSQTPIAQRFKICIIFSYLFEKISYPDFFSNISPNVTIKDSYTILQELKKIKIIYNKPSIISTALDKKINKIELSLKNSNIQNIAKLPVKNGSLTAILNFLDNRQRWVKSIKAQFDNYKSLPFELNMDFILKIHPKLSIKYEENPYCTLKIHPKLSIKYEENPYCTLILECLDENQRSLIYQINQLAKEKDIFTRLGCNAIMLAYQYPQTINSLEEILKKIAAIKTTSSEDKYQSINQTLFGNTAKKRASTPPPLTHQPAIYTRSLKFRRFSTP